jgi:Lipid A 3-O-deacylase (PagL)
MSIRSRSTTFLLGLLFTSLLCYSLSSDCLSQDDLSAAVSASPDRQAQIQGSSNEFPDGATPRACALSEEVTHATGSFFVPDLSPLSYRSEDHPATPANNPATVPADSAVERVMTASRPADRNREIYYRNKTEFAFDLGTLPINIPFPFDFMEGDPYTQHPIRYVLIPMVASLRWHMSDIGGPWIFRGNWDLTSSGSFTWIPSGPETRFISYDMGVRRNFVPHNRNWAPYFDIRLGVGQINAKGPKGVPYAQGEDWPEFTMNMGSGVRYNFSPRFAFTAGLNYMHLSNMDLSEHKPDATDPTWGPINYGINVYGPQLGINMRLGKSHRE